MHSCVCRKQVKLLHFVYVKGFVKFIQRVSPGSDVQHAEAHPYTERRDHDVVGSFTILGHFLVKCHSELVVRPWEADEVWAGGARSGPPGQVLRHPVWVVRRALRQNYPHRAPATQGQSLVNFETWTRGCTTMNIYNEIHASKGTLEMFSYSYSDLCIYGVLRWKTNLILISFFSLWFSTCNEENPVLESFQSYGKSSKASCFPRLLTFLITCACLPELWTTDFISHPHGCTSMQNQFPVSAILVGG